MQAILVSATARRTATGAMRVISISINGRTATAHFHIQLDTVDFTVYYECVRVGAEGGPYSPVSRCVFFVSSTRFMI